MDQVLSHNEVNRINDNISVLPLNLQDHLIFNDDSVVGMYHKGRKTAILNSHCIVDNVREWLKAEGYEILFVSDSFVLSVWTSGGHETCGKFVYDYNKLQEK